MSAPIPDGEDLRVMVTVPVTDDRQSLDDVADHLRRSGVEVQRQRGWDVGRQRSILAKMRRDDIDGLASKIPGIGKPIVENVYTLPPVSSGPSGADLA